MTSSEPQSRRRLRVSAKAVGTAMAVTASIGFLDASYLTAKHYLGGPIPCSFFNGCDTVTTSEYASLFGIPVALLGVCYYLAVAALSVWYLESRETRLRKLLSVLPIAGFAASLWFVYVQAAILKTFCLYCLISAVTSTALLILGIMLWRSVEERAS